jgi:hypothetical protein
MKRPCAHLEDLLAQLSWFTNTNSPIASTNIPISDLTRRWPKVTLASTAGGGTEYLLETAKPHDDE